MSEPLPIDDRRTIPAAALRWTAVRASGPGGQHVNRTESKVVLRFDPSVVPWLNPFAQQRLRALAGDRLDAQGCLLLTSQATREQSRNLDDARRRLAELVRKALVVPKRRVATKPSRSAKRRRLDAKRKRGDKKRMRRKVGDDD